jgi:RNA polymerase primary sigma factor
MTPIEQNRTPSTNPDDAEDPTLHYLEELLDPDELDRDRVSPDQDEPAPEALDEIERESDGEIFRDEDEDRKRITDDAIDTDDIVGLYLKEAAKVPLLDGKEEVQLAKRMEAGKKARATMANPPKGKTIDRKELLGTIEDGWSARQHLIEANARLVISIAKKNMNRGVPFIDLIQEGNLGLMRATKKFDYRRGFKFSTYATWWIRQAITRAISNQRKTIRIPAHMGDKINNMFKKERELKQILGDDPTEEELANALGTTEDKVDEMKRIARDPYSLEYPIRGNRDGDADNVFGESIEDEDSPKPEEKTFDTIMREDLIKAIEDTLPVREAVILRLRYALDDGRIHTLSDVGRKLGVTRERIRQLEAQALRKLRDPKIRSKLKDYLR